MSHTVIHHYITHPIHTYSINYEVSVMPMRKGKKIRPMKELITRGEHRVDKLAEKLKKQYPNASVIVATGKGTDIIVVQNKRVIEAWESLNWARFDFEGKDSIYMDEDRKDMIIKSLKKKRFGLYSAKWMASKDIKLYLAVSYKCQIQEEFLAEFDKEGIEVKEFKRQDLKYGYFTWDNSGKRSAFYDDGTELL